MRCQHACAFISLTCYTKRLPTRIKKIELTLEPAWLDENDLKEETIFF